MGRLLLSVTCLALATAHVFKMPLTHVESMREKLIRENVSLEDHIKTEKLKYEQLGLKHEEPHSYDVTKEGLQDYNDNEYLVTVSVGTPANQSFKLVMDLQSDITWVPDENCNAFACILKNKFDSTKSTTFHATERKWIYITEPSRYAIGQLGIDTITFSTDGTKKLTVFNQTFGRATTERMFENNKIDGVFGMGFSSFATNYKRTPILNAFNQHAIDSPTVTVWMTRNNGKTGTDAGQVTFGGLDPDHCSEIMGYKYLTSPTQWQFILDSVSVGTFTSNKGWYILSTLSNGKITLPHYLAQQVAKAMGARFRSYYSAYEIPCAAIKTAPQLKLTIGGVVYEIESKNLFKMSNHPSCRMDMLATTSSGYGSHFSLGAPFTRQFCQILDFAQQRIGFARAKY